MSRYETVVQWSRDGAAFRDNRYSRAHLWSFDGGVEVSASSSPQVVPLPMSVEAAVDPEEAFVVSLSSCHMLWFLSLAAGRGFVVDSYRDAAVGVLAKDASGRLAMTRVTLRPEVRFGGERQPTAEEILALHHEAHDQCFIARSVRTELVCEPVGLTAAPATPHAREALPEETMNGTHYLADVTKRFREAQAQCDRAIAQVPFELWNRRLDPESNSIATLMLHLSGNMISRWTDFLTADGEKPDRNRDTEFEDPAAPGQSELLERWARGWACLFGALQALTPADLERTVTIRAQPHTVVEAIDRQLTHYAYHAGQMVFLCKHLAGPRWGTLSVARRGSAAFNAEMAKRAGRE